MSGYEIEGMDELLEQLDGLKEQIMQGAAKALQVELANIQADAKRNCGGFKNPTGELQRSIIVPSIEQNGDTIEGAVLATATHAVYVEMGTGQRGQDSDNGKAPVGAMYTLEHKGMPARPYLYPAYKVRKDKIIEAIRRQIMKGG